MIYYYYYNDGSGICNTPHPSVAGQCSFHNVRPPLQCGILAFALKFLPTAKFNSAVDSTHILLIPIQFLFFKKIFPVPFQFLELDQFISGMKLRTGGSTSGWGHLVTSLFYCFHRTVDGDVTYCGFPEDTLLRHYVIILLYRSDAGYVIHGGLTGVIL